MTGEFLKTGIGVTMTGELAAILNTGIGVTITGELLKTGIGVTITGEFAASPLWADVKCVGGAATALTADRAIAEPITTHETFNHDEGIWITPLGTTTGIC